MHFLKSWIPVNPLRSFQLYVLLGMAWRSHGRSNDDLVEQLKSEDNIIIRLAIQNSPYCGEGNASLHLEVRCVLRALDSSDEIVFSSGWTEPSLARIFLCG